MRCADLSISMSNLAEAGQGESADGRERRRQGTKKTHGENSHPTSNAAGGV